LACFGARSPYSHLPFGAAVLMNEYLALALGGDELSLLDRAGSATGLAFSRTPALVAQWLRYVHELQGDRFEKLSVAGTLAG
jgi:hypothetical protein